MTQDWLKTRFGIDFVAIGLVAVCIAAPIIVLHDIWFVTTGEWPRLWLFDKVLLYLLAAVAVVFSVASVFVFRPGLPKWVATIVAVSFASYVVQPLVPIHSHAQVSAVCVARAVGLCTILLLVRSYVTDLKAGKAAR